MIAILLFALALLCAGCSTSASTSTAACNPPKAVAEPDCVATSYRGNALGVGAYCLGGPCQQGYVGCPSEEVYCSVFTRIGQSFCTKTCNVVSDCGLGAICQPSSPAYASGPPCTDSTGATVPCGECVPNMCLDAGP
jgi:hypothetical protein